jgi:hypothetical protein
MSEPPIRVGWSDAALPPEDCTGCEGTALATPRRAANRPSLPSVDYLPGDHARFKASMLAGLSSASRPALARLGARDDADVSIALIDAWASVCDALAFYQERLANEAFLGTATERLSIAEIARLTGYRLNPGAAAETDLALIMEDPPGAKPDVAALAIPAGLRVQSQPGPDETPQVFETLADLEARVAWNRLKARRKRPVLLAKDATEAWFEGQATGLKPGDAVLIVHPDRLKADTTHWAVRRLTEVTPDAKLDRTRVRWSEKLPEMSPADDARPHAVFALRREAGLFGATAPHPLALTYSVRAGFGFETDTDHANSPSRITGSASDPGDWVFTLEPLGESAGTITLDVVSNAFAADSWVVLLRPGADGPVLRRATASETVAESRYAVSARATRLTLDGGGAPAEFAAAYRRTTVLGGGEPLTLAETPMVAPIYGTRIELAGSADSLPAGRRLIVTGRRAQGLVAWPKIAALEADLTTWRSYPKGSRLTALAPPMAPPLPLLIWLVLVLGLPLDTLVWLVADADGKPLLTAAPLSAFEAVEADATAPEVAEVAVLDKVESVDPAHDALVLKKPLAAVYDRASLAVLGNVAAASQGETAREILGSGDPATPHQAFTLKQNPVTHRVAATETGVASTLSLSVDKARWREVPDFLAAGPSDRVFVTALSADGETTVRFGDGRRGARPPAGRDNLVAAYRKGLGAAGNVRAGQLSIPLDRPLGLKETTNPLPASGGADPESDAAARRNGPLRALTVGRVVSLTDYRDFALGYPGVAKADARWVWDGRARRVVVTVAGEGGKALPLSGPTVSALREAFGKYGDPFASVEIASYAPSLFHLGLKVAVGPDRDPDDVLEAVETALRAAFAFDARDFAQPVALSEVAAAAHRAAGVEGVDVDVLRRAGETAVPDAPPARLTARAGRLSAAGKPVAAEILTLAPGPFDWLKVTP